MSTHKQRDANTRKAAKRSQKRDCESLPETGFVRIPTILRYIPVSRSTWWNGVKDGRFPQPIKLGPQTTAWRAEDIRQLIAQMTEVEA